MSVHLNPLVKWSGGKKDELQRILPYVPKDYKTYIEPFVGGGALYFHLNPEHAVIADVHTELIDLYTTVGDGQSRQIREFMDTHPNDEETYYHVRSLRPATPLENAQRFYYLRKTCYRGMLRYNKKGEFNIPFGRYRNCNYADLSNAAYGDLLKRTTVCRLGFTEIFKRYNDPSNFIFLDPPYDSEFTDYGYCQFGQKEHRELSECFKTTKNRCLMVIGETDLIKELYNGYIVGIYPKQYKFRLHSGRVGNEINTNHLVIANYPVPAQVEKS